MPMDHGKREAAIAEKLSRVVNVLVDLNNEERLRIIKAAQAFYGAWDKKGRNEYK